MKNSIPDISKHIGKIYGAVPTNDTIRPLRLTQNDACRVLSISRTQLARLRTTDPTFPQGLKYGDSRQASRYYDYAQLKAWHEAQFSQAAQPAEDDGGAA